MDNKEYVTINNKTRVYTNINIPGSWKQKQDYRELMFSTMNQDKIFFDYLANPTEIKEEKIDTKNKKNKNFLNEDLPNIDDKPKMERKKTNISNNLKTSTSGFNTNINFYSKIFSNL